MAGMYIQANAIHTLLKGYQKPGTVGQNVRTLIKSWKYGGQVICAPRMFRIDEKLEFKSDNFTTMINNIPDTIALSWHHRSFLTVRRAIKRFEQTSSKVWSAGSYSRFY
jgi:hypothetical protein